MAKLPLMTVGHSTLPLESLLKALADNGVKRLVDVRAFPGSRRHPQFGREALERSVPAAGIQYEWTPDLGGRRKMAAESVNGGWRNASFRAYADYMQTPEFVAALERLIEISQRDPVAYMCSEAVPWRCHRTLISDALMARGFEVEHIYVKPNGESVRKPHSMTPFARVERGIVAPRVTYPANPAQTEIPFQAQAS